MNSVTNKRIILVDPFSTGHHIDYARNVILAAKEANLKVTLICNNSMSNQLSPDVDQVVIIDLKESENFLFREFNKIKYLRKVNQFIENQEVSIVHFLYLDRFIRALMFCSTQKSIKYFATCHWFYMLPEFSFTFKAKFFAFIERLCLKVVLFRGWHIISHSKIGSKKLIGNEGYVLDYPVEPVQMVSKEKVLQFRESLGLTTNSTLLLCFGGTRYDKGSDLAVKVLAELAENVHLIVAGKEESISFNSLATIAKNRDCSKRLHLLEGFVSDKDTALLFNACDIVFIPYRSDFSGQSGPLTIGASLGKCIISSDVMILEETINRFKLGEVLDVENISSAAKKINKYTKTTNNEAAIQFNKVHSISSFLDKLSSLYIG